MDTALAFSGGKDSFACLYLNQEFLDNMYVIWVNTGKNYPETLQLVELAKSLCKHFVEISVDKDRQNAVYGLPADLVPVNNTYRGKIITGNTGLTIQSYLDCCQENISNPINRFVEKLEIQYLISGQRNDEGHKHPLRDGDVLNGVTHLHPVENWTSQEVLHYLATKMDIPQHFHFKHSSLDCYDCTAYQDETKDISEWAARNHQQLHQEQTIKLDRLYAAIGHSIQFS
jgi:3'-phosphoadenosine 5'-phosphosulfate sulfotransferase (PAPS reductase)/FAD synthetase